MSVLKHVALTLDQLTLTEYECSEACSTNTRSADPQSMSVLKHVALTLDQLTLTEYECSEACSTKTRSADPH